MPFPLLGMAEVWVKNLDNDVQISIEVSPNETFSVFAESNIKRGQCILTDPGLVVFPSGLKDGPESSALIKKRIDSLSEKERQVFFTLPNHREGEYDEYYGRYHAHASIIRHSPEYSCIFPLLSLVAHGCSPNCVTAVVPTYKTTGNGRRRNGWKLALRASEDIVKGEEITFFKLKGGGMFDERREYHVERFGFNCPCNVCELPMEMFSDSEENRSVLSRLYSIVFEQGRITSLRLMHYIEKMVYRCHSEDINDKSLLVLYRRLFDDCVEQNDLMRVKGFADKILRLNDILIGWECDDFHQGHAKIPLARLQEDFKQNPGIMMKLASLRHKELYAWLFRSEEILREMDNRESYNDFRDEAIFPTYMQLPEANSEFDSDYLTFFGKPKRHWFYLASPSGLDVQGKRIMAWDRKEKRIIIDLNNVIIRMENLRGLLSKSVVLIPYASKTILEDGKEGISAVNYWIKVISGVTMFELTKLSCKISIYSAIKENMRTCHGCNTKIEKASPKLLKCSRCGLFWYCSKDCQVTGWRQKGHKEDCTILSIKAIYDLFCMDMNEMIAPVSWDLNIEFLNSDWNWSKLSSKSSTSVADLMNTVQPIGAAPPDSSTPRQPANPVVHQIMQKIAAIGPL